MSISSILDKDQVINKSETISDFYNNLKVELESDDSFFFIKPSKDKEKLDDDFQKFNAQNDDQKHKADIRSMTLYGMTNYDHYYSLLSKIKKGTKDDEVDTLVYNKDDHEVVKEGYDIILLYKEFGCSSINELDDKIKSSIEFNTHTVDRVIIYPTDNLNDLEDLYLKFMALDHDKRVSSDNKCKEVFGKANREIYSLMKEKITTKDKDIEDTHTIEEEPVNTDNTSIFSNDLPLLTPKELSIKVEENYDCFNEQDAESIKRWRQEYALMGMGIKTENYNKYNLERINILRKAIYQNNEEAIIQCGWVPGIEFNSDNRVKASEIIREKMEKDYGIISEAKAKDHIPEKCTKCGSTNIGTFFAGEPIYKCKDCGQYLGTVPFPSKKNESYIEEASNNEDKHAVSIILVSGSSILAKTIKKVQGTQFSHASISLDDDISKIYSFNMRNGFNGLTYESMKNYIKEGVDRVGVYTFLVSDKVYKAIEKVLDNFSLYIKDTKYSILNLFTIPLNIPLNMNMKMVCSEFVDTLLKAAHVDLTNKKSSLVSPKDFINATKTNTKIVEVYNGHPKNFNPKEVEKKIKNLKKSRLPIVEFVEYNDIITEAKSFPIQFDSDGNLILKNIRSINFEQEYANSHRLLKEYEKTKSYEPMKFELAKMQFFITLLEKKIYKYGKDKTSDELKVRARFLNDFKKYLKIVTTNDSNFNFTEYYEQSPFNDALIKIDKSTLKFGFEALKYLIK